jgi:hypothetical protein
VLVAGDLGMTDSLVNILVPYSRFWRVKIGAAGIATELTRRATNNRP